MDLYFDGLSYRRPAENIGRRFARDTASAGVCRRVRDLTKKADEILRPMQVTTGDSWVADEPVVSAGGQKCWRFNVMDSETRLVRAAATALILAREKAETHPGEIKADGLRSCREALPWAFPARRVIHAVSKGIRAEINNNLSERRRGPFRDWYQTLRGLKAAKPALTAWHSITTIFAPTKARTGSGRPKPRARHCRSRIGQMSPR